jgi:hypothetical protein
MYKSALISTNYKPLDIFYFINDDMKILILEFYLGENFYKKGSGKSYFSYLDLLYGSVKHVPVSIRFESHFVIYGEDRMIVGKKKTKVSRFHCNQKDNLLAKVVSNQISKIIPQPKVQENSFLERSNSQHRKISKNTLKMISGNNISKKNAKKINRKKEGKQRSKQKKRNVLRKYLQNEDNNKAVTLRQMSKMFPELTNSEDFTVAVKSKLHVSKAKNDYEYDWYDCPEYDCEYEDNIKPYYIISIRRGKRFFKFETEIFKPWHADYEEFVDFIKDLEDWD